MLLLKFQFTLSAGRVSINIGLRPGRVRAQACARLCCGEQHRCVDRAPAWPRSPGCPEWHGPGSLAGQADHPMPRGHIGRVGSSGPCPKAKIRLVSDCLVRDAVWSGLLSPWSIP